MRQDQASIEDIALALRCTSGRLALLCLTCVGLYTGADAGMETVMVIDMGTHMLRHVPGLHLLVQILPPGLEERARALPPLLSSYSTPGMSLFYGCITGCDGMSPGAGHDSVPLILRPMVDVAAEATEAAP